jgi:hypothetical protein
MGAPSIAKAIVFQNLRPTSDAGDFQESRRDLAPDYSIYISGVSILNEGNDLIMA